MKKNETIGKWCLDKHLGSGGQGQVWRVRYTGDSHSAPGALKLCSDQSEKARTRFARERDLLVAQQHPGIVRVRDSGEHLGNPYFVMELANTTLGHISIAESAGTRLVLESRELLLRFIRQACEALAHLHKNGILHRDIKPSNVLLVLDPPEPMRAVVADLGIAASESEQGKLTATHETIGTPAFRAPEAFGGQHTSRSDVYSFGKTIEAVFNRGASSEIGPGKCLRDNRLTSGLWEAIDFVLERACAFDPKARYADASELLEALPKVVLGLEHDTSATSQSFIPATLSLTVSERVALSDVIAECPLADDSASLQAVRRRTRLNEYHFSLAIRRLIDIAFIDSRVEPDYDGDPSTVVQPTPNGIAWARDHHDEVVDAIAEVAPKITKDDEFPF